MVIYKPVKRAGNAPPGGLKGLRCTGVRFSNFYRASQKNPIVLTLSPPPSIVPNSERLFTTAGSLRSLDYPDSFIFPNPVGLVQSLPFPYRMRSFDNDGLIQHTLSRSWNRVTNKSDLWSWSREPVRVSVFYLSDEL